MSHAVSNTDDFDLIREVEGRPKVRLATQGGKEFALEALRKRRANPPTDKQETDIQKRIESDRFFNGCRVSFSYCLSCGHHTQTLNISNPPKLCKECRALKELGWLEK